MSLTESETVSNGEMSPLLLSSRSTTDENVPPSNPVGIRTYGPWACFGITVNCIFGTAAFGIPYAFVTSGYILLTVLIIVMSLANMLVMNYCLELLARTEGVVSVNEHIASLETEEPHSYDGCSETSPDYEYMAKLKHRHDRGEEKLLHKTRSENSSNESVHFPLHKISFRKFDYSYVAFCFNGNFGRMVLLTAMSLYSIGTLWSYGSVFSSSMAVIFFSFAYDEECKIFDPEVSSECLSGYYVSVAIFFCLVAFLSILQIGEQAWIQGILALYRGLVLLTMLITLIIKMAYEGSEVVGHRISNMKAVDTDNFGAGFGVTLLALICQYNMPDLLQPLENKKENSRVAAMAAVLTTSFGYLCLGLLTAFSFDHPQQLCTVNWNSYTTCGNGWDTCDGKAPKIASVVRMFVQLFPPVCALSAYPIVNTTLSATLTLITPSFIRKKIGEKPILICVKLVLCVIPLLLAGVFKKLDVIFGTCGLLGFFLSIISTCYLNWSSIRYCVKRWGAPSYSEKTAYHIKILSSSGSVFFFLILFLAMWIYSIVNFIMSNA